MTDGVAPIHFPCSFEKSLDSIPTLESSPYESNEWVCVKKLGKACFGRVLLTKTDTDNKFGLPRVFVVKEIRKAEVLKQQPTLENPCNEIHAALLLAELKLLNFVKIYGVWQDSQFVYLVSEYFRKGELFTQAASAGHFVSSEDRRQVAIQMFTAICQLHDHGIAHRDVSLENFLVQDDLSIGAIDLGQAIRVGVDVAQDSKVSVDSRGLPGKVFYIPPELNRKRYEQGHAKGELYSAKKMDMYQLGVALFAFLVGRYPVEGIFGFKSLYPDGEAASDRCRNLGRRLEEVARQCPALSDNCQQAKLYLDLLEQLMAPNPDARPDADAALQLLNSLDVSIPSGDPSDVKSRDSPSDRCGAHDEKLASAAIFDTPKKIEARSHDTPDLSGAGGEKLGSATMPSTTPYKNDEDPRRRSSSSSTTAPLLTQRSYDIPFPTVPSASSAASSGYDTAYGSDMRGQEAPDQSGAHTSCSVTLLSTMSYDTPYPKTEPSSVPCLLSTMSYDTPYPRNEPSSVPCLLSTRSYDTPFLRDASTSSFQTARTCASNGFFEPLSPV